MRKKLIFILIAVLILAASLTACRPKPVEKSVNYGDIYVTHSGISPYTKAELAVTLPEGVEPLSVKENNSSTYGFAYLEDYDLLVCQRSVTEGEGDEEKTYLLYGFYSFSKGGFLGTGVDYPEYGVKYGMITLGDTDNNCLLMKTDGTFIFDLGDNIKLEGSEKSVSEVIIPLSEKYIAVRSATEYYKIYDINGREKTQADGSDWTLNSKYFGKETFGLKAVDDYIVSTRYDGTTQLKVKSVKIYDIVEGKELYDVFADRGAYDSKLIRAVFYLGNGRFYCSQTQTSTKEDGYQYEYDGKFYKILQWTYDAAKNERGSFLSPDLVFSVITNKYYSDEVGRDIGYYLKDGYSFVEIAFDRKSDKTVTVDQFVIDSNLNIYVSLVSHRGSASVYDANSQDYRDVKLMFIGDIGFSTEGSGELMIYDTRGNTIFKKDGNFSETFYNNGIVTAKRKFDSGKSYYAAYYIDGREVFNAESRRYQQFSAYVGNYALAQTSDGAVILVDRNGRAVSEVNDIYKSSSGVLFYKAGVYVSFEKKTDPDTNKEANYYGLKAYDGTVLIQNEFKSVVIDKRGTNTVLFFAQTADKRWSLYKIK